jgi:hypothetical protein
MPKLLVAASFATVVLSAVACAPKPTGEQLPPAGLAGAPGTPAAAAAPGAQGSSTHATPQPSAALTSLPGAGHNVPAPAGGTPESAQLPAGHPPIDTGPTTPGAGSAPTGMAPPGMGSGAQEVQITGKVLEAIDVPTYTYMRLQTSAGEEWAAVNTVKVNVGDTVTVNSSLVMENFRSSSLNRTFPKLMMGMLVGAPKR